MNFLRSLYCWFKYNGHTWMSKRTVLRAAKGRLEVLECSKCGMKMKRIRKTVGVK